MYDICVNTIVRNGEDFIKPVLEAVIPYAKRVRVGLDNRSSDKTRSILTDLGIEVIEMDIKEPLNDLVTLKNKLLEGVKEKYIWVVDSDEYYPEFPFLDTDADVYTFQCHAPWSRSMGHKASARAFIPRIFRNDGRRWTRTFGKERLQKPRDKIEDIPYRYIHLTHLKDDKWRDEMKQPRKADGKSLYKLPDDIIKKLDKLYEKKNM